MNSPHRTRRAAALLASLCGALALRGSSTAADVESPRPPAKPIEFNRDVRPILAGSCFACHGPDKGARKADLRLDQRDGLFGSREGGAPVVPRDPSRSQLFLRVTSHDPAERMPPPETGKTLSPKDIATLERWIAEGATWQGHWAYLELRRPELPADSPAGAAPIDRFILARLREVGLEPSPEADARTLVRRLSIDITGLPPEPARVEEYVRSPSAESYERLVDEFLASPQYGERMAAAWLDLVRYADSVGFHGDQPQTIWPFRDYVIRAFNENLPFDRFTQEQIAGDLIPNATLEQKIAAAYNRLNMMSAEGGGQDKEYIAKYASDRVRATSIAWLGATLGCAECHDHKFDPFTSRDFYSFAAFFADVSERGIYGGAESSGAWGEMLAVPSPQQADALRRIDGDLIAAKA
ncbi:MAG TPA: DUF1549 domain-containing protein, partial [Planctomycetota bacterium]|nr:DUF1549 domain-containing protein [Planctomycetota bacterium]